MTKRTPTQQQLNVIAAVIDPLIRFIKIMAAAGAGKTTVLKRSESILNGSRKMMMSLCCLAQVHSGFRMNSRSSNTIKKKGCTDV